MQASAATLARFGDYFASASRALAVLAQQVRCSVVDGPTGSQAARVATTHVLGVAAQLVSALSLSDAAAAVPPALAVALGDAACDEALATTTPFLRQTLRPYLALLDAAAAADLAATDATTAAAVQAAEEGLLGDEATPPGGPYPATDAQLDALDAAIATLRFAPDAATTTRWVALLAAGRRWDEPHAVAGLDRRAVLMAALLTHRNDTVRMAAYDALVRCVTAELPSPAVAAEAETMAAAAAAGVRKAAAMELLTHATVLREVAERGVHDTAVAAARSAGTLALEVAGRGDALQRRALLRWLPWLECAEASRAPGAAAACAVLMPPPSQRALHHEGTAGDGTGSAGDALVPASGWAELQPQVINRPIASSSYV
jgi:hypothetical protein